MEQQVRFCVAPDGVRLAYALHGSGPPIVRAATWLTHLDFDRESPVWRHWLAALGAGRTVVRYDERGCGLSDRDVGDLSFDVWVSDLETVVAASGLEQFALLGFSQGAAVALVYAARHPDRVTHLVLYGAYARGRRWRGAEGRAYGEAMISAIRAGWSEATPTFRHLFSMLFLPHGSAEQMAWYDELQRRSTSAETAVRLYEARNDINVLDRACDVTTPTLVLHARDDRVVPVEEGRLVAARVPGARFVLLDSANHILLADEPAWQDFLVELDSFLPAAASPPPDTSLAELSARELDVLELVAGGLTNEAIADRLCLSVRTVERHLSNIYVKLRVSGRAGRAAAAARFSQTLRAGRRASSGDLRAGADAGTGGRP
jgi:pimeloyl-ACP methyl ester carboxylesterase/DNA-binding CsgD family transcriptional regulator